MLRSIYGLYWDWATAMYRQHYMFIALCGIVVYYQCESGLYPLGFNNFSLVSSLSISLSSCLNYTIQI